MPPERSSSNDLLLEQLQELLRDRQRDQADGLTLRAVARMAEKHSEEDRRLHDELEKRVRDLETGRVEPATGRFQIPPYPQIVLPVDRKSKRPSLPPWLSPKSPIVQWAAIGLLALAHVLARAGCGVPLPPAPAPAITPTSRP